VAQQVIRWIAVLGVVLSVGLLGIQWGGIATAQIPGLSLPEASKLPTGVTREGQIETKYIMFDGSSLFKIASPRVPDREKPGTLIPVETRSAQIEKDIQAFFEILHTEDKGVSDKDPTSLENGGNTVNIEKSNGLVILVGRGNGLANPRNLLTITQLDAEYYIKSPESLAEEWRGELIEALNRAVRTRRPEATRQRWETVRNIAIAIPTIHILLSVCIWLLRRRLDVIRDILHQKREKLAQTETVQDPVEESAEAADPEKTTEPEKVTRWFDQMFTQESQFNLLAFCRWILVWIIFTVWIGGVGYALYLFPETRRFALYLVGTPLLILVAFFLAGLVNRLADLVVDRLIENWRTNQLDETAESSRVQSRIMTISGVIRAFKFVVIYFTAIGLVLSQLDVVPWSLVTIGALVAFAASFAAQSLVKDVVIGILILMEDQFAVNDYVTIGDTSGTVEYMNLRVTRIRTPEGRLVTLPNSLITKVENLSRSWSLITVEFEVPPTVDVNPLLETARQISQEMANDPDWQDSITNPDKWSGVQSITRLGVVLAIAVETKPLKHWSVGRELRRRLKASLDTTEIYLNNLLPETPD